MSRTKGRKQIFAREFGLTQRLENELGQSYEIRSKTDDIEITKLLFEYDKSSGSKRERLGEVIEMLYSERDNNIMVACKMDNNIMGAAALLSGNFVRSKELSYDSKTKKIKKTRICSSLLLSGKISAGIFETYNPQGELIEKSYMVGLKYYPIIKAIGDN